QSARFATPGSESVEGKSVELGDGFEDDDAMASLDDMEQVRPQGGAGDPTERAIPRPGPRRPTGSAPRVTGAEATSLQDLSLPVPDEGRRSRASLRRSRVSGDLSLPMGDLEEGPPPTRIASGGMSMTKVVVGLIFLAGAGYAAWRFIPRGEAGPI